MAMLPSLPWQICVWSLLRCATAAHAASVMCDEDLQFCLEKESLWPARDPLLQESDGSVALQVHSGLSLAHAVGAEDLLQGLQKTLSRKELEKGAYDNFELLREFWDEAGDATKPPAWWQLGHSFAVLLAYVKNSTLSTAGLGKIVAKAEYNSYSSLDPCTFWNDDFEWWVIALLDAQASSQGSKFDQGYASAGRKETFAQAAKTFWNITNLQGKSVYWSCSSAMDPNRIQDCHCPMPLSNQFSPKFEGGIWNTRWTKTGFHICGSGGVSVCPKTSSIAGRQNTVTNALNLLSAQGMAREFPSTSFPDGSKALWPSIKPRDQEKQQFDFMEAWSRVEDDMWSLIKHVDGQSIIYRERVGNFTFAADPYYGPNNAWIGDQGIMLASLVNGAGAAGELSLRKKIELRTRAKMLINGVFTVFAQLGGADDVKWIVPLVPMNSSLWEGFIGDYAAGVGVFFHYLRYVVWKDAAIGSHVRNSCWPSFVQCFATWAHEQAAQNRTGDCRSCDSSGYPSFMRQTQRLAMYQLALDLGGTCQACS